MAFQVMTRIFWFWVLAGFATFALGQANLVRIRGNVESFDGKVLNVKARSGQSYAVKVPDNLLVIGVNKASVSDITKDKYVGTTTVGERNGALVAQEVHIFLENMRGTGEGHRDWDLGPTSKMTNASVANIVKMSNDHEMTVQYKGGEKKVLVTPETSVVAYSLSDKSELKPGAPVFINAQREADGSISTPRVNVGLKGQVPPM
jgi:hypothetical protein